jgi:hypothetical protein
VRSFSIRTHGNAAHVADAGFDHIECERVGDDNRTSQTDDEYINREYPAEAHTGE